MEDENIPEYSYFETIYHCGKNPRWKVGDVLSYYEFYSDAEGEISIGKVIGVEYDKEADDWVYAFENNVVWWEEELLREQAYKKD